MKKGLCLIILSLLLACFCFSCATLPAFAAQTQVASVVRRTAHTVPTYRRKGRGWYYGQRRQRNRVWKTYVPYGGPGWQELNQFHSGDSNYNSPTYPTGHGQGNTGNHGHNLGRNQDNSSNGGNQLVMLNHLRGYRRINQYAYGHSNYNNAHYSHGYDQGNSGNDGRNDGLNQDNSSNSGNQIVN